MSEIVEKYGVPLHEEDAQRLVRTGEKEDVVIYNDHVGGYLNKGDGGRRWVERVLIRYQDEDKDEDELFVIFKGHLVKVVPSRPGIDYFRSVEEQPGQVKLHRGWAVALPCAQSELEMLREIRGAKKWLVVVFNGGRRGCTTEGCNPKQACNIARRARGRGQEVHILHEDDIPEDFTTTTWEREEWNRVISPGPSSLE